MPLYQALNLQFINEFAWYFAWPRIDEYLMLAGLPERTVPIACERDDARKQGNCRETTQSVVSR